MTTSVVRRLILKDLYLARWLIIGSIVAGVASLAIAPLSPVSFYVGSVMFLCVLILLNVTTVMLAVTGERKERVSLFILSLPISTAQYATAKLLANCIAFLVPYLLLTAASVLVIKISAIPAGFIPFSLAVMGFILFYYSLLLTVSMVTQSQGWHTAVIVFGNVCVNFVIAGLLSKPSVMHTLDGHVVVWTQEVTTTLAIEVTLSLLLLTLAWRLFTLRKDFV